MGLGRNIQAEDLTREQLCKLAREVTKDSFRVYEENELLLAENKRLRGALEEWMLHHYGTEASASDEVAGKSHSCSFCWDNGCEVLGIGNTDRAVKEYLEQALKEKP